MAAGNLETLEKRMTALEQEFAQIRQERNARISPTAPPDSRARMLAALEKITPISQEDADRINSVIQEAREQSIADNLSSCQKEFSCSRRNAF